MTPNTNIPFPPNMKMEDMRELVTMQMATINERDMRRNLTEREQVSVCFIPLVIAQLAWEFADQALREASSERVEMLKKISRVVKQARVDYKDELLHDISCRSYNSLLSQSRQCMDFLSRDFTIMYFSVSNVFKRSMPHYPFKRLRCLAIMSYLMVGLVDEHNRRMDALLSKRLRRDAGHTYLSPHLLQLRKCMAAFAGVDGKFNYRDINVQNAVKVIHNRMMEMEFTIENNQ